MGHLRLRGLVCNRGFLGDDAIDGDRARLRAAVEANTAAGAGVTFVCSRVNAIRVQVGGKFQDFRGTGLDAETAALAFFLVDLYITTWLIRHFYLAVTSATALRSVQRMRSQCSLSSSRNLG